MKKTHRNTEALRNHDLVNQPVDHLTAEELEDEVLQIICGGPYQPMPVDDKDFCW